VRRLTFGAAAVRKRMAAAVGCLGILCLAACGGGGGGADTSTDAPIRTLAYIVTECHDTPTGAVGRQRLEVLRGGDSAPRIIKELDAFGPLSDPMNSCRLAGLYRLGHQFLTTGVFQRLGVSPDGSRVVFEVTDAFATVHADKPLHPLPDAEKGIFAVGADGSGLRRLAPASHEAPFRALTSIGTLFAFDPAGNTVAYTDIGPGIDAEDAIQIATLDLDAGTYAQVTHLPPGPLFSPDRPATLSPFFLDARRIAFFSTSNADNLNPEQRLLPFTVERDGTGLMRGPQPLSAGEGSVVPEFAITGPAPSAVLLSPTRDPTTGRTGSTILDVFLLDGDDELQLTNLDDDDITDATASPDGSRIFFNASADPCTDGNYQHCTGSNPSRNCQIFSVDRTANELRQLTAFNPNRFSFAGCYYSFATPSGVCSVNFLTQDTHNETLVFYSTCTPLAPADFVGAQIYAMRPDGSGLRPLTQTRGLFTDQQGFSATELPGPLAYSSSSARSLR
jgi:hypothetical protein